MSIHFSFRGILARFFCVVPICLLSAITLAQTYTVLYQIPNQTSDVYGPNGGAIAQGRNGDLYTTASNPLGGELFSATTSGVLTPLYNVGGHPYGGATAGTDGNLYGGTVNGGANSLGYIYKVTPAGVETDLHDFDVTDGSEPIPPLVQAPNGLFYGIAWLSSPGYGTIFSISSTGTFKVLHTFAGGADGQYPHTGLTLGSDGNLYGGTSAGGKNSAGVLFRITPSGIYTVLYNFCSQTNCADGQDLETPLTLAGDGNLYGMTYRNASYGNTNGVLFRLTNSGAYTALGTPNWSIGAGMTLGTDGKLYGTFSAGGSGNNGHIFSATTSGVVTLLHSFCQDTNCTDGYGPSTPLIQATDGLFYGFTGQGGVSGECNSGLGCGVFYSLNTGAKPFIRLSSTSGSVGSTVAIFGQGFDSASVVKFNGVAAKIVVSGTTYITATVPAAATDGRVTVTTGTTTLTSTKTFIVHNTWSKGTAMPTAVDAAAAGFINGKIYVVGGGNGTTVLDNNQVYNTVTNTWTTAAAIPSPVSASASAVVNGILYIFGGYTSKAASNEVQAYSPLTNKWTTKAAMPTARGSEAAVVDGTSVYVIGGYTSTSAERLTTVEKYNTITNTWTAEAPLLVGKSEPSAGLVGSTIVAADGYTTSEDTGDNEAYNIATNKWSAETADPKPRNAACFGAISGQLYVIGGGDDGTPQSTNEAFNPITNKWTTFVSMPLAVIFPSSVVANGQLYCFGGANVDHGTGTFYSNVQIYQP